MTIAHKFPVVKAEMLIRRPTYEVFEAFENPAITTKFWFTKSSGRLEAGSHVRWEWEMYGVSDIVHVKEIRQNDYILLESSDGTLIEWVFATRDEDGTFVTIANSGFTGTGDEILQQAIDSMGGYTMVLCGLKAYLEHGIVLNLVADKAPDAHVQG
ncbi:polyketide cyclase [Paenibacillus sp. 1011MAR3C5]|uniref:SRPBCC family protein n=1 Tax=Paenibacillus sp. 1011MAR3C5 TaxID=1675787 RepID=UPI000E6B62BD|nr:SRPBCC family protein [Paenibacillus sp. 1011MAR3C5]RJE90349.1 polyketide cyclase [Paenibacillus sp. 1011MAR3C5]